MNFTLHLTPIYRDIDAAVGHIAIFFTIFFGFLIFLAIVLGVLATAFWIWMLVDAVHREFEDTNLKVLWIIILILMGFVGSVIYYFVVKRKGAETAQPSQPTVPSPPPKRRRSRRKSQ